MENPTHKSASAPTCTRLFNPEWKWVWYIYIIYIYILYLLHVILLVCSEFCGNLSCPFWLGLSEPLVPESQMMPTSHPQSWPQRTRCHLCSWLELHPRFPCLSKARALVCRLGCGRSEILISLEQSSSGRYGMTLHNNGCWFRSLLASQMAVHPPANKQTAWTSTPWVFLPKVQIPRFHAVNLCELPNTCNFHRAGTTTKHHGVASEEPWAMTRNNQSMSKLHKWWNHHNQRVKDMSTARVSSSLMLAHLECLQDLRECEGKGKLHDNERHSMAGGDSSAWIPLRSILKRSIATDNHLERKKKSKSFFLHLERSTKSTLRT